MTPNLITSLLNAAPGQASLLAQTGSTATAEDSAATADFAQLMQGELAILEAGTGVTSDAAGAAAAAVASTLLQTPETTTAATTAADTVLPGLPPEAATGGLPGAGPVPAATSPGRPADVSGSGEIDLAGGPGPAFNRDRGPTSGLPADAAAAGTGGNTPEAAAMTRTAPETAGGAAEFTAELGQAVRRAVSTENASGTERASATTQPGTGASATAPAATAGLAAAAPVLSGADPGAPLSGLSDMQLTQPFATDRWEQELGMRLNWMADSRMGRAELRLNPPELGPLEVSLNVNSDEVSVSFQAQHAATREAVENALPRLREMLAQNGLTLANADVSQQSKQDSGGHQPQARSSTVAAGEDSAPEGPTLETAPVSVLGSAAGLLDTYA